MSVISWSCSGPGVVLEWSWSGHDVVLEWSPSSLLGFLRHEESLGKMEGWMEGDGGSEGEHHVQKGNIEDKDFCHR